MHHQYRGKCCCGLVTFSVYLPQTIGEYAPRACDCDFCTYREITYLSDPDGAVEVHSKIPLKTITQGSGLAKFLSCEECNVVVAVVNSFYSGLKGAINATLIEEKQQLQKDIAVSPKLLTKKEKINRWDSVWLKVTVHDKDT
jgi:hypothetical protein